MSEWEAALSLTSEIYDAALDPGLWPGAVEKITGFVGGVASALHSQDLITRTGRFHFSFGDDPHYTRLYFEKYAKLNPVLAGLLMLKPGDVRTASQLLPTEKFRTTRFYKEWAGPAGYGDLVTTVIARSGASATSFSTSIADEASPIDPGALRRFSLVVPHVARALAIGNLVDMHKVEAELLADAVDALPAAVFLVRRDGSLVRANGAGRAMIAAGGMVCLDDGALVACGASDRRNLREAIVRAIEGEVEAGATGLAIPLVRPDDERYVAHILPLTSGRRRGAAKGNIGAAVFVHRAAIEGLLPLEAIAREFGLSAAEVRVLVAVVEVGGSATEIADVLGLSEPTIRTHLRRLFEKTGTHRQADLVKLVAGYSNPLIVRANPRLGTAAHRESSNRMMSRD